MRKRATNAARRPGRRAWSAQLALGTLCISLALCGCGVKQEVGSSSQPKPFAVMLDAAPNANHAALYSAIAHGEFRAAGLDVTALTPPKALEPLELLAAGRLDMAIASEPELLLARDRGLELVSIAALAQRPLAPIIAPHGGQVMPYASAPTYDGLVLIVRRRQAEHDGEDLRAFLHALTRGQQVVNADPAGAAALLAGPNRGQQRSQLGSIERALPSSYPASAGKPYGYQDPPAWASFANWMYSQGYLHTNPSTLAPPLTNEFLPGQGI
jgi:ABC-type nitrate/sulfonate/bicarbonate transport system substrate-binding protein